MRKVLSVIIFFGFIIHFDAWSQPGCDASLCISCEDNPSAPPPVIDNNGFTYADYPSCYTANAVGSGLYTDPSDCQANLCNSNIPINANSWALIPLGISVVTIGWVMVKNRNKQS